MAEHAHITPATLARRRHVRAAPGALDRRCVPAVAQVACAQVTLLAEAKIGSELKAAQDRGEVATQDRGGANIGARTSGTVATLPTIGIPSQRAAEYKTLSARCLFDVGEPPWRGKEEEPTEDDLSPRFCVLIPASEPITVAVNQPSAGGTFQTVGRLVAEVWARGAIHHYRISLGDVMLLAPPHWLAIESYAAVLEAGLTLPDGARLSETVS